MSAGQQMLLGAGGNSLPPNVMIAGTNVGGNFVGFQISGTPSDWGQWGGAEVNGQEVLGAHPPSQMDFRVPAGTRAIRVGFGYLEATLPHVDHTNGVDFSIVALDSKGNQVAVFSRRLDPAINPAHREPQQERLELPTSAVLVQLQTGPGPANDISFDWVYWRDLVFETAPPAPSVP